MSEASSTQRSVRAEVDATIATLMDEGRSPTTVDASAGRLEALELSKGITPEALTELRSAIELLRDGQSCAAVSSLLAVRSALGGGASSHR